MDIAKIILIGFEFWFAINVFFIIPHIDRLTEFVLKGHSFSFSKGIRMIIAFAGVFTYIFVPIIRRNRKEYHYEHELNFLKEHNYNGNKNKEIQKLERSLKLYRLKNKSKKFKLNFN